MAGMDSWGEAIFAVSDPKDKQTIQEEYSTSESYQPTHRRREDEVKFWPPIEGEGIKMMDSQPQAKQHDSVLNQNYQYLADNIERLYNQVENLEQRLKIILTDAEPETQRDSMGYGGSTPLSENLAQLCRRTQDLSDRLNYLTARIDL